VWTEVFWKNPPEADESDTRHPAPAPLPGPRVFAALLTIVAFNLLALWIGLYPEPMISLAEQTAGQLIEPSDYIQKVLGNLP